MYNLKLKLVTQVFMQGKKSNVILNFSFRSTSRHEILNKIKQMSIHHLADHDVCLFFQGLSIFQLRNNNSMCLWCRIISHLKQSVCSLVTDFPLLISSISTIMYPTPQWLLCILFLQKKPEDSSFSCWKDSGFFCFCFLFFYCSYCFQFRFESTE